MTPLLQTLERKMALLIQQFAEDPYQLFHENEVHAVFFGLTREPVGAATPRNHQRPVHLLRHEYDTIWRYSNQEGFRTRFADQGTTACLDFAVLKEEFITANDLLTVINKDENRRKALRRQATGQDCIDSPAIHAGVEFKMLHVRTAIEVMGDEGFVKEMHRDSRKLGLEGIAHAYVLGLSHGPWPEQRYAATIASECRQCYQTYKLDGSIRVLVATPAQTTLLGNWTDSNLFPNPHVVK